MKLKRKNCKTTMCYLFTFVTNECFVIVSLFIVHTSPAACFELKQNKCLHFSKLHPPSDHNCNIIRYIFWQRYLRSCDMNAVLQIWRNIPISETYDHAPPLSAGVRNEWILFNELLEPSLWFCNGCIA